MTRKAGRPAPGLGWFALAIVLALGLRVCLLPLVTVDAERYLVPWIAHADAAGAAYLGRSFTNYAPAYDHLLFLASLLPESVPDLARVKLVSIAFDLALAALVWAIARRCGSKGQAAAAAALILLLPTIAINSAFWGQSDAVYTTFLMAALLLALADRPALAALCFSAAFAFKMQALLFAPVLALLWLGRRQPAWTFALLPVGYVAASLPAMAAGRPLGELFGVYAQQVGTFERLSLFAPNPWFWLQTMVDYDRALVPGIAAGAAAVLLLVLWLHRKGLARSGSPEGLLLAAAILLVAAPYLMPKMHERFFYPADPVLVILAVSFRGYAMPLILAQGASLLAAVPFSDMRAQQLAPLLGRGGIVDERFGVIGYNALPALGTLFMGAALILLLRKASRFEAGTGQGAARASGDPRAPATI
jgi:Gpi18-like mannosyltransferase